MNRLISLCVVGLLAIAPLGTVQPSAIAQEQSAIAEVIPELFGDGLRPAEMRMAADPTVLRRRTVRVNIDLLDSVKADDRFVFNLFEDATFSAHLEIIKNRDTWVGSIEGKPAGTFTLVMNDGSLSAIIRVPSKGIYRVRSLRDGVVVIQEIDETRFPPCGIGPAQGVMAGGGAAAGADCDDGSVIDVLVVYTLLARDAAGGTAAIEAEINLAFANTNTAYNNSLIGTQLNLIHVEEIPYDEAGTYVEHLYRLTDPADGYMDNVHDLRDQYGADMVALLVDDGDFCGVAWLMQDLSPDFEQYAFSVTTWYCAAGNLTFAHELGHNQGCCHDRDNCGQGVFDYSYGYQDPGAQFRTVMAYNCPGGCPRIQHFSNPDVFYQGLPTGVPIDQPDSAHNALTINQTALTVANFRCHGGDFVEIAKLVPGDGVANDRFGESVAISGATAIVGAVGHDDNGSASGAAYLFDTTTGQQLFKLLAKDGAPLDSFGDSVAISGATAIVGAQTDDDNGGSSGSAYLFDTTAGWQLFKLLPNDGAAEDRFGWSVAISGATAIVGAYGDDDNGDLSGSAYLFDISDPANPTQIAKLLADDGAAGDRFGQSVAINGATAIVGADRDDDNGTDSGSAYLFDTTAGLQIAKLLPNDGAVGDWFGISVAISGATAIVGAVLDDDNGFASGSAYLFDTTTGLQIAKLLPNDGVTNDRFGGSVAISGGTAIVGANRDDDNGSDSGSAYLFDTTTGQQIARLLPSDGATNDWFGTSVAITGTTSIVGAYLDDDNGTDSGSAYLFGAAGAPGNCPWDLDANGSVGATDLLSLLVSWGPCKGCPADFDVNGSVGATDLLALLVNWGPCP